MILRIYFVISRFLYNDQTIKTAIYFPHKNNIHNIPHLVDNYLWLKAHGDYIN